MKRMVGILLSALTIVSLCTSCSDKDNEGSSAAVIMGNVSKTAESETVSEIDNGSPKPGTMGEKYTDTIMLEGEDQEITMAPFIGSWGYTISMEVDSYFSFIADKDGDTISWVFPEDAEVIGYIHISLAGEGKTVEEVVQDLVFQSLVPDAETGTDIVGKKGYSAEKVSYYKGSPPDQMYTQYYVVEENQRIFIIKLFVNKGTETYEGLLPRLQHMLNTFEVDS